jgi:hypothetical protein
VIDGAKLLRLRVPRWNVEKLRRDLVLSDSREQVLDADSCQCVVCYVCGCVQDLNFKHESIFHSQVERGEVVELQKYLDKLLDFFIRLVNSRIMIRRFCKPVSFEHVVSRGIECVIRGEVAFGVD